MKILHVSDHYRELGGAERYLLRMAELLERAGHETPILSAPGDEPVSVDGRAEYFVRPTWRACASIVERERPDVVHLHNVQDFLRPAVVDKLCRVVPVVRTLHDVRAICPIGKKVIAATGAACVHPVGLGCFRRCRPFHRYPVVARELRATRSLAKLLVGSRYLERELIRNGCTPDRIRVIPPGAAPIGEPKHEHCALDEGAPPLVLAIGRLADLKGFPQLIDALALLGDVSWRAVLVITDTRWRRVMEERIAHAGLRDRIECIGRQTPAELAAHYARCRLLAVPSMIPESFGLVGLEAMAHSRPVVGFDAGAIGEWLEDGETGFLVARGDVEQLAERMGRLLTAPDVAAKLGEAARLRVGQRFTERAHVEQLVATYRAVIGGTGASSG